MTENGLPDLLPCPIVPVRFFGRLEFYLCLLRLEEYVLDELWALLDETVYNACIDSCPKIPDISGTEFDRRLGAMPCPSSDMDAIGDMIETIYANYRDVYAASHSNLGPVQEFEHRIDLAFSMGSAVEVMLKHLNQFAGGAKHE